MKWLFFLLYLVLLLPAWSMPNETWLELNSGTARRRAALWDPVRLNADRDRVIALVPQDTQAAAVAHYLELVKKYAPEWLEEYAEVETQLSWQPNEYAAYALFNHARPLPEEHECTSWLIGGELTPEGKPYLHKNRDSSSRSVALLYGTTPGRARWIGLGDAGSLAPCMGINEYGLAGAMNSGDLCSGRSDSGLTTPDLLRLLLEQEKTAQGAAERLQNLVKAGAYAHNRTGSIFFFTDGQQNFIVENDALHAASAEIPSGILIRANIWRLPEMMAFSQESANARLANAYRENRVLDHMISALADDGKIDLAEIWEAARDNETDGGDPVYPPCGVKTNSAVTLVVDPEFPDLLSTLHLTLGPPRQARRLAVPLCVTALPPELLNTTFGDRAYATTKEWDKHAEAAQLKNYERNRAEAQEMARKGDFIGARNKLNAIFQAQWQELAE